MTVRITTSKTRVVVDVPGEGKLIVTQRADGRVRMEGPLAATIHPSALLHVAQALQVLARRMLRPPPAPATAGPALCVQCSGTGRASARPPVAVCGACGGTGTEPVEYEGVRELRRRGEL